VPYPAENLLPGRTYERAPRAAREMAARGSLLDLCRPRTSLGCLYSDAEVASLRAWMASGARGPALVTAGPGSGLTTLLALLVREVGLDAVWVGSATPRIKQLLQQAGASPVSVTLRRKIIVVDELDALAAGDAMAMADALAFARSAPPLPVLFASHATRSQKSLEFARAWPRFALGRPAAPALAAYLGGVARKHGVPADEGALRALADRVRGDVRAALMALELVRGGGGDGAAAAVVDVKDERADGLDLAEAILRGERGATVPECLRVFGMEPAVVPMGVYENYLSSLGRDDLRAACEVAHGFSDADLVDRYLYARQAWDVMEAYGVCCVAAPSLALRRHRRRPPPPSYGIAKFGTVWSKVYNMCAKAKHVKQLAAALAEAGVQPLGVCDLSWVRARLKAVVQRGDATDEDVRAACWPLGAAQVLCLARLDPGPGGSAWYKQAVHARVRRALAPP
jgi:hypothetical protein